MKKPYRKISDYAIVGGLSALVMVSLVGCKSNADDKPKEQSSLSQSVQKGAFVILEEQKDKSYKVVEEYPSSRTHIIVRDLQGNERVLSNEEIQKLIKEEEAKIDNGTSKLIQPNNGGGGSESSGFGLGSAILGSAAGAILGSYIGNKLFNNPNYQQNAQRTYKSPQAYQRSQNSFSKSAPSASSMGGASKGQSGFFGSSRPTSSPAVSSGTRGFNA
ncbi:UPF0323 family lipoprotein [Helicobacter pylori]|uniref:UPF0323 family lipoprotein n=1 Tax=Helicobacter pylori TaxID=210 RepID=UPI0003F9427A|nr:UPF0323 family lipoprotein [Helicobacter pylori]MBH0240157.1 UPF0323 family lipoprotein [Helicobacter pylori]MUU90694.1 hypothetical protein [Helicobacter pylori]PUD39872.1 hypothetical protein C2R75_06285 [Helicobacter pylori]WQS41770.1 UPF0323 family lipoprotein [Helicobacter pylori]WQS63220.1 UPF0323 family lipoprotein [Helicobacter pylori]